MKISVITICYNNETEIRQTIESVVCQTHDDLEYIVVDGASKDGSLAIINEYKDRITKIISEPDKGIYDAINKGIRNATGEVIGLVHAGDRLFDKDVIRKIAEFHEKTGVDISYGSSQSIDEKGRIKRIREALEPRKIYFRTGWMPSHMSIYAKKEVFEKYGYYRQDIGYAADYEWVIRTFMKNREKFKIGYDKGYRLFFSLGGLSTSGNVDKLKKDKHKNMIKKCWEVNDQKPFPGLLYTKALWYIWTCLMRYKA